MKTIIKLSILALALPLMAAKGQTTEKQSTDSLSLSQLINEVISNYPALKKVDKDIEIANAKIGMTKTAYLPDVVFSSSYSHIGPISSMNFNGHQINLYPADVYNATFSVNENIYDFGKTAKTVAVDEKSKQLAELSVEQVKQRISMALMANYYTIGFLQEAIRIKNEQLKTLNEHLLFMEKKAASGSATEYEILSTKVRISGIENQKTDLLTALEIQNSQLNSFLGKPSDMKVLLKTELMTNSLIPSLDSLCTTAYANRNELKVARQREEITKSRLEVIKVQNNPSLNAFASGGFKNGYLNSSFNDVGRLNYAVGVGLKVPLFDANRSKFSRIQVNAEVDGIQQETELLGRSINNEVVESRANAVAALKKLTQSELQLEQATQAYQLSEISYKTGLVTNLDVLFSFSALAESKLALFKAKIDYSVNMQRLKIALGERIY